MQLSIPPALIFTTFPDFDLIDANGVPLSSYKKIADKNLTMDSCKYTLIIENKIKFTEDGIKGGIPFGIYSRLLLFYICSEITNKNTQIICFGTSITEIAKNIKVRETDITVETLDELEELVERMIDATFTITIEKEGSDKTTLQIWDKSENFRENYKAKVTKDFYNLVMKTKHISINYDAICELQ